MDVLPLMEKYRLKLQAVAIIDMLVGTIPFINLAFAFNDKSLADIQDREYLVLAWMTLLCVYVLQLIMGIWLLAGTRECYSQYTVGNCQVWYYIAMFTFVFYIGEMGYAISVILKTPKDQTVKKVIVTMIFHATKIIYRAITLMTVNNFLYDICRPVYKYLSKGSYMYTSYYNYQLGIPPPMRRRRLSSVTTQLLVPVKSMPQSSSTTTQQQQSSMALASTTPAAATATAAASAITAVVAPPLAQFQFQQPPLASTPYYPTSPPILPPPPPTPAAAIGANVGIAAYDPATGNPLPVYNSTKIPLQPIPNYNFYFTYPQPKPKHYRSPYYDASVNYNYASYYYAPLNSAKPP